MIQSQTQTVIFDADLLFADSDRYREIEAEVGAAIDAMGIEERVFAELLRREAFDRGVRDAADAALDREPGADIAETFALNTEEYGEAAVEAVRAISGEQEDGDASEEIQKAVQQLASMPSGLVEQARETLQDLHNKHIRLVLLSRGRPEIEQKRLRQSGLRDLVDHIEIVPHAQVERAVTPEVLTRICEKEQVAPENALFIGTDERAAVEAGLQAAIVDPTLTVDFLPQPVLTPAKKLAVEPQRDPAVEIAPQTDAQPAVERLTQTSPQTAVELEQALQRSTEASPRVQEATQAQPLTQVNPRTAVELEQTLERGVEVSPQTQVEQQMRGQTERQTQPQAKPLVQPQTEVEPVVEPKTEAQAKAEVETEAETKAEEKVEAKTQEKAEREETKRKRRTKAVPPVWRIRTIHISVRLVETGGVAITNADMGLNLRRV